MTIPIFSLFLLSWITGYYRMTFIQYNPGTTSYDVELGDLGKIQFDSIRFYSPVHC